MSYYFGCLLTDLTLLCCDRTRVFPEGVVKFDEPRFSVPYPNVCFCPTGNLRYSEVVIRSISEMGRDDGGGFDVSKIIEIQAELQTCLRNAYRLFEKTDEPTENVDVLFGGKDFIGCLSSANDFKVEIRTGRGSFITLNQSPEVLEHVRRNLEIYIRGASDIPLSMKKELARGGK